MLIGLCFSEGRKELNEGLVMLIVAMLGPPVEFVRASEADVVVSDDPDVIVRALDMGRAALLYCFDERCEQLDKGCKQLVQRWERLDDPTVRRPALEVVHHADDTSMERFYAFLFFLRKRLYTV